MNRSNSQARACSTEMIQVTIHVVELKVDVVVVGIFDVVAVEVVNEC